MDRLLRRFDSVKDADLKLCPHRGVAYQRDMTKGRVAYDAAYLQHYKELEGTPIARALNAGRCAMLARVALRDARVLDVGVGSGLFLTVARDAGYDVRGYDVNPQAVLDLRARDLYADDFAEFDVVTFWDSLEHIEDPGAAISRIKRGAVAIVALPVFDDLTRIRESKHYKPGEHLYYWTEQGFVDWMSHYGFRLLERSHHEVEAGREGIAAFAFVRDLPQREEYVNAYRRMHLTRFYGSSATELHLNMIAELVRANRPKSILDYGCGRSDLVAHFYLDGARRIERYDPAIRQFRRLPRGPFDMVLCCDVMEHIPLGEVDAVLEEIRSSGKVAVFTISLKPARARLPDGSNAHCTLLTRSEWERWIGSVFGSIVVLPPRAEHECNIIAGEGASAARRHRPCVCGGTVRLESYNPIKRPVEWFMRCERCGGIGPSHGSEREAEQRWAESQAVEVRK
jgi:2-polyprenyl-3-methyl-5-hydroxy-6-metoxy-1,4-benzoquinol methylase